MSREISSLATLLVFCSCVDAAEAPAQAKAKAQPAPVLAAEAAPAGALPASNAKKRPKLVRAQPLAKLARFALHRQMVTHGDNMESLLWSALMLDYESIALISQEMSLGPTLSRPMPGVGDTINSLLPPRYFTLQDQLASSIGKLRDAASAKDDEVMAVEYANVTKACIQCHSLYLNFEVSED